MAFWKLDRSRSKAARAAAGSMQDTGATDVAPSSKVVVHPIGKTILNAGLTVTTSKMTTCGCGSRNGSARHGGCSDGGIGRGKIIEVALVLQGSVVANGGVGLTRCICSNDIGETTLHVAECFLRVAAFLIGTFHTGNKAISDFTGTSGGNRRARHGVDNTRSREKAVKKSANTKNARFVRETTKAIGERWKTGNDNLGPLLGLPGVE